MELIVGSEAIAEGLLTRGQLRWNYVPVHPDVYAPRGVALDWRDDIRAAWLWSRQHGIVSGLAAAALHGARDIPDNMPVALIASNTRAPEGISVHHEAIDDDEITTIAGMRVTTPARTALDLARRLPRDEAVEWLDKLDAATTLRDDDLETLLARYRNTRGIARARDALRLRDGGARSARETKLRLTLRDAGLPRPETNIAIEDGICPVVIGLGWRRGKVGLRVREQPDGGYSAQVMAARRNFTVHRLGWVELDVVDGEPKAPFLYRVRSTLLARGGWG